MQPPRRSDTHHLHCDGRRTSELLGGQHHVRSLLLQKDHDEFRWLRRTRIATDRVHIVGSFIESLPWHERDFLTTPQLHDNRALQDVDECVCIVTMDGVCPPGGYSTVIINISLPGTSASSFSMSGVTTGDSAPRADRIGCEPNARTSAMPRMSKVDIATPFRLLLRKRDLM